MMPCTSTFKCLCLCVITCIGGMLRLCTLNVRVFSEERSWLWMLTRWGEPSADLQMKRLWACLWMLSDFHSLHRLTVLLVWIHSSVGVSVCPFVPVGVSCLRPSSASCVGLLPPPPDVTVTGPESVGLWPLDFSLPRAEQNLQTCASSGTSQ